MIATERILDGSRYARCIASSKRVRWDIEIFGNPDDMKFRSCVTLFAHATKYNQVFVDALQKYCGGKADPLTLERL